MRTRISNWEPTANGHALIEITDDGLLAETTGGDDGDGSASSL